MCGDLDVCPYGDDNLDSDDDGTADLCDPCPNDVDNDLDQDGLCGDVDGVQMMLTMMLMVMVYVEIDVCPAFDDNLDSDSDGLVDGCDVCPNDAFNDLDNDSFCADVDDDDDGVVLSFLDTDDTNPLFV